MKWIFSLLFSSVLYVVNLNAQIGSETNVNIGCSFIPFYEYKIGMSFYFPPLKEPFRLMQDYEISSDNGKTYKQVSYEMLEDKFFTITAIQDAVIGDRNGMVIFKATDGTLLRYEFSHNLQKLSKNEGKDAISLRFPFMVSIDEVKTFSDQFSNKEFYTKFQVEEKKYRKVKIISVSPGKEDAPIHVKYNYLVDKDLKVGEINVCSCGTNLLPALIPNCSFLKFFSSDNPRQGMSVSDVTWDLITQGKIKENMTQQMVLLSLGNPLSSVVEKNKSTMIYKNIEISIIDDKVVSIKQSH